MLIPDRAYARAFTLRVGLADQSYVDLDDPVRLDFDYVQQIALVIDAIAGLAERRRVLHIGGGGLTLPRYLSASRTGWPQLVLEPNAALVDFVRTHLPLPVRSGIRIRTVDGRSGVATLRDGFADLAVIDAFVGLQTPAELTTVEFLTDLRRSLSAIGTVIINLTDQGPLGYTRRVLAGLARAFPNRLLCAEAATLKGRRFGNVILVGSAQQLPIETIAQEASRPAYPYRVLSEARLAQLLRGVPPFTDADAEPSPEPPSGALHLGQ
jgi:spermidine synthase